MLTVRIYVHLQMPKATHGDDVPLVFGVHTARSIREGTASSTNGADVAYSQRIISIFTDFAKNGCENDSATIDTELFGSWLKLKNIAHLVLYHLLFWKQQVHVMCLCMCAYVHVFVLHTHN